MNVDFLVVTIFFGSESKQSSILNVFGNHCKNWKKNRHFCDVIENIDIMNFLNEKVFMIFYKFWEPLFDLWKWRSNKFFSIINFCPNKHLWERLKFLIILGTTVKNWIFNADNEIDKNTREKVVPMNFRIFSCENGRENVRLWKILGISVNWSVIWKRGSCLCKVKRFLWWMKFLNYRSLKKYKG